MSKVYRLGILTALFALTWTMSFAEPPSRGLSAKTEGLAQQKQIENLSPEQEKSSANQSRKAEAVLNETSEQKEKQTGTVNGQQLIPINGAPLSESDFQVAGFMLGGEFSPPSGEKNFVRTKETLFDVYQEDGISVSVSSSFWQSYMKRNDLPIRQVIQHEGISKITVSKGMYKTARGIAVGDTRENLLRTYGKADEILWNEKAKLYHFLYRTGKKELRFLVKEGTILSIEASFIPESDLPRQKPYTQTDPDLLADRDMRIAGYELHTVFSPRDAQGWEKKMSGEKEEILYYPGFSVQTNKRDRCVDSLFITGSAILTSRGITLGDDVSTVDLLYGPPHKLEVNTDSGFPKTAYIYFSQKKRDILIIYIKDNKVDGILATGNPQRENG